VVVLVARAASIRRVGLVVTGSLALEEPSSGRLPRGRAGHVVARALPACFGLACHVRGAASGGLRSGLAFGPGRGIGGCTVPGPAVTSGPNKSFKPTAVRQCGENHASAAAAA
jgi:hypothetical protein